MPIGSFFELFTGNCPVPNVKRIFKPDGCVLQFSARKLQLSKHFDNPAYVPVVKFICATSKSTLHVGRWYYYIDGVLYMRVQGNGARGLTKTISGHLCHLVRRASEAISPELKAEIDEFITRTFK